MITAMTPATNPIDPKRPLTIQFRSGTYFLYLHDVWYANQYRHFIGLLRHYHTDHHGPHGRTLNGHTFRYLTKLFKRFRTEQSVVYGRYGVLVPHVKYRNVESRALPQGWTNANLCYTYLNSGEDLQLDNVIHAYSS